jgi:hypothetical protein
VKGEGAGGFIRTAVSIIVIAVGYQVPFRQKKGCGFPVFRAAGVIAAVLLGLILRRVAAGKL